MKKAFLAVVCLGILLVLSVPSLAEGFKVDGGYLFGKYEGFGGLMEAKANGFIVTGEGAVSGPFGIMGQLQMLKVTDLETLGIPLEGELNVTRFDVLGTYALPLDLPEGSSLKAVGGYTSSKFEEDSDAIIISGFLVGAAGELLAMDKLTVSGFFGLGFGMKAKADGFADTDYGFTSYRIAGNYQVMDNVSIQGGYTGNKYSYDVSGSDESLNGFFFGALVRF